MGIGVALLLAAANPAGVPAQVVAVPLASDPALAMAQSQLRRPVITWAFAAPTRAPDLRSAPTARVPLALSAPATARRQTVADIPDETDEPRLDKLVVADTEARMTGRRARRSAMAAGLSLKVVQADGVLSPLVGMSGPVGKALTRIAAEAVEAE